MMNRPNKRGAILILVLWALGFLSILALQLGMNLRQKIALWQRLEERRQLHYITDAGIQKAMAYLRYNVKNNQDYTAVNKVILSDNENEFAHIDMGKGFAQVSYSDIQEWETTEAKKFGVVDEESKLNINEAKPSDLKTLLIHAFAMGEETADELAKAIIDWRDHGHSELSGFYGSAYYENLKNPYTLKNADYEILDELLLIQGITKSRYQELLKYITIYGEGKVNINTAPAPVLLASGFSEELTKKILAARRGYDGREGTPDDYIFLKIYDFASELGQLVDLKKEDIEQIDQVNFAGRINTVSQFYFIQSTGYLLNKPQKKVIQCVFNVKDDKMEYYRERFNYY